VRTNLRISDPDLRQVLARQLQLSRLVQRRWSDGETWYVAERFGMREAIAAVQHERNTRAARSVCELAGKIHL